MWVFLPFLAFLVFVEIHVSSGAEKRLFQAQIWENLFHYQKRTAKFKLTRCALRTIWVEKFLTRMQNRFFHASNRSIILMNRLKVQWHRWYSTAIGRSGVAVSRLQLHSYRAVHRDGWQKFPMSAWNLRWLITVFLRDPPHRSGHTQAHLYVLYKFCSRILRLLQVRISFSEFLPNFVKYCRYSYVLMSFLMNWQFFFVQNWSCEFENRSTNSSFIIFPLDFMY